MNKPKRYGKRKIRCIINKGIRIDAIHFRGYFNTNANVQNEKDIFFGVGVPRKVKEAVKRNRIKRLVRESFRLNKNIIHDISNQRPSPTSIYLFYQQNQNLTKKIPNYREVEKDVKYILMKITEKIVIGQ